MAKVKINETTAVFSVVALVDEESSTLFILSAGLPVDGKINVSGNANLSEARNKARLLSQKYHMKTQILGFHMSKINPAQTKVFVWEGGKLQSVWIGGCPKFEHLKMLPEALAAFKANNLKWQVSATTHLIDANLDPKAWIHISQDTEQ